jgi:Putative zincin peptidase
LRQLEGGIIIKIKNGLPKFDQDIHEKLLKDDWKELKGPKSLMGCVALSVPFMIVNFLIGMWIMEISTSRIATDQKIITIYVIDDAPVIILAAIVLVVVHELIHLLFIPNFIKSDNTYIGFTYFGGYVSTKEALTKYRLCLILIAPFVFLSIIFNAILGSLGFYSVPLYNVPLIAFIIFNSTGSSVDILSLTLVLLQVPKDAYITSNGMRSYWKNMNPILTEA